MNIVVRSPKDLGQALKRYRLNDNISQAELAESIQTHQMGISRIETGRLSRTLSLIFSILKILDLEIEIRPRRKGSAKDIEDMFS